MLCLVIHTYTGKLGLPQQHHQLVKQCCRFCRNPNRRMMANCIKEYEAVRIVDKYK